MKMRGGYFYFLSMEQLSWEPDDEPTRDERIAHLVHLELIDDDTREDLLMKSLEDSEDLIMAYEARYFWVKKHLKEGSLSVFQAQGIHHLEDPQEGYVRCYFEWFRQEMVERAFQKGFMREDERTALLNVLNPEEAYWIAARIWWFGLVNEALGKNLLSRQEAWVLKRREPSEEALRKLRQLRTGVRAS